MAHIQPISYVHGQSSYRWFFPEPPEYTKPIHSMANKEPMHRSSNWLDLYAREERQIKRCRKRDRRKLKSLQSKRLRIS